MRLILDEKQNYVPTPLTDIWVRSLCLKIFDVLQGIRPVDHLSKFVTPHVTAQLGLQRSLHLEREAVFRHTSRVVPIPGHVILSETHPAKFFCAVVMHMDPRSSPISMTLEYFHTGWRATEIHVL